MQRTRSLTTKGFKAYKVTIMIALSAFVFTFAGVHIMSGQWFGIIYGIGYPALLVFYWFPSFKRSMQTLKELSYDKKNLYVHEDGYEIQIPFHQVRDVQLVSLDGLYRFRLYHNDQFGKEVMCKPSFWYPFNFKRIDAELERIRSYVRQAHRDFVPENVDERSLPSN